MKFLFQLSILISVQLILVSSGVLPKKFPKLCSKSLPDYEQCKIGFWPKAKPYFVKGVPSLGLPSLNPFRVVSISLNQQLNDQIRYSGTFSNMESSGFKEMELTNYDFDHKTMDGSITLKLPLVTTKLDYNITAHVFGNKIKNVGSAVAKTINLISKVAMKFKKVKRGGTDYLSVEKFNIDVSLDDVDVEIGTTDTTYQSAIDEVLNIYNQDHQRIIKLVQPVVIDTAKTLAKDILEAAFNKIPVKELIPEN